LGRHGPEAAIGQTDGSIPPPRSRPRAARSRHEALGAARRARPFLRSRRDPPPPTWRKDSPMRKTRTALLALGAVIALAQGCAPIPLPRYAAYPPKRVEQLLYESENLRQIGDEWNRFWFLDQPSHLTPYRTHGGLGF